jgi:DNA-binding MarR family transcriptional regulator
MTAVAPLQQSLDLGSSRMPFAEAARRLTVSQADLCAMILSGHLTQVAPRHVDALEVEQIAAQQPRLAERMRRSPDRLPRTTESALWLLADWGGTGRPQEVAAVLQLSWQNTDRLMKNALQAGFVDTDSANGDSGRKNRLYTLTAEGWEYVDKYHTLIVSK